MHEWVSQALGCAGAGMPARLPQLGNQHGAPQVLGGLYGCPGCGVTDWVPAGPQL